MMRNTDMLPYSAGFHCKL